MKRYYKYIVMVLMVAVLITPLFGEGAASSQGTVATTTAPAIAAAGREEVIYANLKANGDVNEVYVVNILDLPRAGAVTDYGSYESVKNLTNTEAIGKSNDKVTVNAPAGRFYYQGALNNYELPWRVRVLYYLDGKEIKASELAGKNGFLEIKINTSENIAVNPSFFENYLLQISIGLDASKTSNIDAKAGTIANAGKNKLITYTVMPGKAGDISIGADVTDFEMYGIELAAVPFSMGIDTPDTSGMTENMMSLADGIKALKDGVGKLEVGSLELKKGAADLEKGSEQFNAGIGSLNNSSKDLLEGSKQIKEALKSIAASLQGSTGESDFSALAQLPEGLRRLATGLEEISGGLTELKQGFGKAYTALNAAILEIPDYSITQQELAELYMANPDKKTSIDKLVEFYAAGQKVKGTYEAVGPVFAAVDSTIVKVIASNHTISGSLSAIAKQVVDSMAGGNGLDQVGQLTAGLSILSANYESIHAGWIAYTGGISELASSYASLHMGVSGIAGGNSELHGGINELYAGATKLYNGVKEMPTQIEAEIDKMMSQYDKSDFKPISFVSSQNEGTKAVQFVIKTEGIAKPKEQEKAEVITEKSNIWTRFLALFK